MVRPNKPENPHDIDNFEHENDIQAKRVTQIDSNGGKITPDNPLHASGNFGVPNTFSKTSRNERPINIVKGQLNHGRLRPEILNEHAESSREQQSIVTSTNKVGQIIKLSKDNINAIYMTAESAGGQTIDDFESYANDTELQAAWVPSTTRLNFIETSIVDTGLQSMGFPITNNGDEWVSTFSIIDYTGYTGSFSFRQDVIFGLTGAIIEVFIEDDSGNSKFAQLAVNEANNWTHFDINEAAMIEDQAAITDVERIIKIGYRVDTKKLGATAYIDNLVSTPPGGSLGVQLWNMGTDIPQDGVTSIDSGTQYTQIGDIGSVSPVSQFNFSLEGGKRLYHLHDFVAGVAEEIPGNELLNIDNYYMLIFTWVDTDVTIYGPDSSFDDAPYYNNGYAFTAPDNSTPITQIGLTNDLMFSIFSTQDVYMIGSSARANAVPNGNSSFMSSIEDKNMKTIDVIHTHGLNPPQNGVIDFSIRPILIPKGGKFNLDYNDDFTDLVTKIFFGMAYLYEPPNTNG